MGFLYHGKSHSFINTARQRRYFVEDNAVDKVQFRQGVEQSEWTDGACMGGTVLFTDNQRDNRLSTGARVYRGESSEGWACGTSGGVDIWQFIPQITPTN
jgi:hypothetical protein